MESQTSLVARNYRLQEWAEQIRSCNKSLPLKMSGKLYNRTDYGAFT